MIGVAIKSLSRKWGRLCYEKSYPAWQQAQSHVTHKLGPDGVAALKSVVRKLHS